jgi:glycosyltransferase involved in cell wall biosynthesis
MPHPKITVYCISHDYGEFLEQAVESVLRQTTDNWELLLIDNASVDKTASIIDYYRNDPRIRAFRLEENGNLPSVCNFALKQAKGEYVMRLDGDDFLDENILLILGNWLDRNSEHVLVFPDYYLVTEAGEIFSHERRERLTNKNHLIDMPANGACTLVRTDLIRSLGGYREDLGAQDGFDLWTKINDHRKFANVNLPLFYYRRHGRNLTGRTSLIQNARRTIKLDTSKSKLDQFRPVNLVIPCRKNYDFMADAWNAPFQDENLLKNSLRKLIQSSLIDHFIIACDNEEIVETLSEFDDERILFHHRRTEDTYRSTPLAPSLAKAVAMTDPEGKGITLVTYAQAPFVSIDTIEEALSTLVLNEVDSSMAVEMINDPIYKRDSHGLLRINQRGGFSSDFDQLYQETNCVTATRSRNLVKGSLLGSERAFFLIPPSEIFFINSQQKLEIAQIIERQRRQNSNEP